MSSPWLLDPRIAPHALAARRGLAATCAVTLAATGASVFVAFSLAGATSRLLTGDSRPWWVPLLAALCGLFARAVLLWARDILALRTGTGVARQLRRRVLDHVLDLGPGYSWPGGAARAHAAVVDGCEHIRGYVGSYLPQAITAVTVPLVLVIVIGVQDPTVAAVIVVTLLAVPLGQRFTARLLGQRSATHWQQYEDYGAKVSDSVAGLATLAGLGATARRARVLVDEADALREATTRTMNVSLSSYIVTGGAMLLGTAGATLLASWHAAQGELPVGAVVLVLFLAAECFRPLQELQNYWHEGFYGLAAAAAVNRLLDTEPPVKDSPASDRTDVMLSDPGTPDAPREAPGFVFDDVTLRFPGATRDALTKVAAHIPAGRSTALVGLSGAGKTTLTALLLRDRDPDSGAVLLSTSHGTTDLRRIPLRQLRRLSARVSQDVVLFDGTIRENLLDAAPGPISEEHVERILAATRVDEFLPRLPAGLDSPVGERGRLLSGGQRQRIALARALLQDAPLLVLDEATSALDGENEALVTEALSTSSGPGAAGGQRTLVVIAHRLSTVAAADHVIVLEDGRVAEEGSPQELERTGGAWTRLVSTHREAMAGAGAGL